MKSREEYNAYQRVYQLNKYRERKALAFAILGDKCVLCGSAESLEVDHIDPSTKLFDVSKMWGVKESTFLAELAKCQVLCKKCHVQKTIVDNGKIPHANRHGHISMVRYCKPICEECRVERNRIHSEWKRRKRNNMPS